MNNNEGNTLTREEAVLRLEETLMTLARTAVHEKRLLEYADELEHYIYFLDQEASKTASEETADNE